MGAKKKLTDEERQAKKANNYHLVQKPKDAAEWKRLESVRYDDGAWKTLTKAERSQFKTEIREINQKRFDTILNDTKIWERINSSSDEWLEKKGKIERKKRLGGGKYINEKDIDRAIKIIWGGMKGEIIEEPKEEYQTPYEYKTNEQ